MNDPVLICGGAGFIGTNLASRLLSMGQRVLIYDDLSRPGVDRNLQWLQSSVRLASRVARPGDIRDARSDSPLRPPGQRGLSLRRANGGDHQSRRLRVRISKSMLSAR